jgi:hypothetical protein
MKNLKRYSAESLNLIIIKVESYRAQTGLTQRYNCQNVGHVWTNCKQRPRCLWCGGGHMHRECPEKTNTESTLRCCNCTLIERENPHTASYRGCSHAKGELQRRRANELPRDPLGARTSLSSHHHSSPTQPHYVKTNNTSNHKRTVYSSICHKRNFRKQIYQYRLLVLLTMTL